MATAPVGRPQEVRPKPEMVERKTPEIIKFTRPGDVVSGVLILTEPTGFKDDKTGEVRTGKEWTFCREDGALYIVRSTADLIKKIWAHDEGHKVDIRYEGDDTANKKEGQSAMKIFKVSVSKEKEAGY